MKIYQRLPTVLLILFTLFLTPAARAAERWGPQKTWVFMVGLVSWKNKQDFEPFPAENRKDTVLRDTLLRRGVPSDHVVYLQDADATTENVKAKFTEFVKQPGPNDLLVVYFDGHGYKKDRDVPYLATYDVDEKLPGWKFRSIPDTVDKLFRGNQAVIALDNCYSGAMVDAVNASRRRVSFGVLASSMATHESTGHWTFTEALISGFSGAPYVDLNHDGRITLREVAQNAREDMLFGEQQVATMAFTGRFDANLIVASAGASTSARIGERVEAFSADFWYRGFIVGQKGDRYKIHYYGYEDSDDQWVPARWIRVPPHNSIYKIGEQVQVQYRRKWYPAHVLNINGRSHYVSYDDYDSDENEWVPLGRIRKLR